MNLVTEFVVGELYSNDQIWVSLQVGNMGGIRPAVDAQRKLRHVVVITTAGDPSRNLAVNPYRDRIEGDVLIYTAAGLEGDQELVGVNKRLLEQYTVPVPFYGFMSTGQQMYRFMGLFELLRHYQETQVDRRKERRKVWLFEFKIHSNPLVVPIEHALTISSGLILDSRRQGQGIELEREVADLAGEERQDNLEDIRGQLIQIPPYRFEHLIRAVMEANGFERVSVTTASGDGGIDVNAYVDDSNDFFHGTHVQAQVKRWRHAVGSVEINNFRGALSTTAKGVFVTTSHYTRAAVLEARHESKPVITLIDGGRLSSLVVRSHIDIKAFS